MVDIYAVEGFFVLIGFSLYWAYRTRPPVDIPNFAAYLVTRRLRLVPLYIVATLINKDISLTEAGAGRVLANVTLTLGFIDP